MAEETVKSLQSDSVAVSLASTRQDGEAFAGLYDHYVRAIYRYVYLRVGNEAEAEDLTEQVFMRAWNAWPRYKDQTGSPSAWLYRIAHNLVIDHHRTRKVEPSLDNEEIELASDDDPAEIVTRRVGQARLAAAIRRLRPEQQQVVVLRFVEGLGYPEVAASLGKSEGAVRVIQHRALGALRTILAED